MLFLDYLETTSKLKNPKSFIILLCRNNHEHSVIYLSTIFLCTHTFVSNKKWSNAVNIFDNLLFHEIIYK